MATIKLPFFRGLVPRQDEQHMEQGQAVRAVNTDLDSGELRPLITPHLENIFPRAGGGDFLTPAPVDPSDPIPEVPVPPECIPVVIVVPPENQTFTFLPETITFAIQTNLNATAPVMIRWYIDDVLIPGETEETLTISPEDLRVDSSGGVITRLYGVIKVVVQNPCGIAEAFCMVEIVNDYSCDAFYQYLLSQGGALDFNYSSDFNSVLLAEYSAGDGVTLTPDASYVGNVLFPIPSSSAYRLWRADQVYLRCGQPGEQRYGLGTYANPSTQVGPGFSLGGAGGVAFVHSGGFNTMTIFNAIFRKDVPTTYTRTGFSGGSFTPFAEVVWGNSSGLGVRMSGQVDPIYFGLPSFGAAEFFSCAVSVTPWARLVTNEFWQIGATVSAVFFSSAGVSGENSTDSPILGLAVSPGGSVSIAPDAPRSTLLLGVTANLATIAGVQEGFDVDQAYQAFLNNFQGDPP